MTRPDWVPVEPTSPTLLTFPCQVLEPVRGRECTHGWTHLGVTLAWLPEVERTSSPTMHHQLLEVLAVMVREALEYERNKGVE